MSTEARIWATSTDLARTNQQRKRYFIAIEDGDQRTDVELVIGPGPAISVEPFTLRELNYTVHDSCDHEDDYCVLEDPDTPEYEDMAVNEWFYLDKQQHAKEQAS
jgi:hypothetical protein